MKQIAFRLQSLVPEIKHDEWLEECFRWPISVYGAINCLFDVKIVHEDQIMLCNWHRKKIPYMTMLIVTGTCKCDLSEAQIAANHAAYMFKDSFY